MEGAGHQRRVSDCPKSVPIARSFESVEETSQVAPSTSTNDSVTEITGEGHGRTHDIVNHYEEATKDLNPAKTWNIGMDGP
ncbi:unnamed protein product [Porites lobata]|uniref:Uncharacterized protein n=1 Tax=Porites lobata TaxID=104759 RepID=A0ABN8PZ77_9CNID|nr:unnamed protein product [Porites lobata]